MVIEIMFCISKQSVLRIKSLVVSVYNPIFTVYKIII